MEDGESRWRKISNFWQSYQGTDGATFDMLCRLTVVLPFPLLLSLFGSTLINNLIAI